MIENKLSFVIKTELFHGKKISAIRCYVCPYIKQATSAPEGVQAKSRINSYNINNYIPDPTEYMFAVYKNPQI